MLSIGTVLLVDEARTGYGEAPELPPLVKLLIILVLSLAAWVPVALPLFLLVHH